MAAPNPSTRILVVASDERQKEIASVFLAEQAGDPFVCHPCCVDSASLDSSNIYEMISSKVKEHRCHIVLIEKGLLSSCSVDYTVLSKAASPAQCIVLTSATTGTNQATSIFMCGVLLLSVNGSQTPAIISKVRWKDLARELGINPEVILEEEVRKLGVPAEHVADAVSEIRELLQRMYPSAKEMTLVQLEVPSPSLEKRQTRTIVLYLVVDSRLPVILKITSRERIEHEVSNYREHIDGRLHGFRYARMQESKLLWNFGAVVYHLIGARPNEVKSFSDFYQQQEDVKKIQASLENLFAGVWKDLYTDSKPAPHQSLFKQYDEAWSRIRLKQQKPTWSQKLRDKVNGTSALAKPSLTFPGILLEFPNPTRWALENHERFLLHRTRQAVTHGDLHADNIFIDEHGNPWLIDFERSGCGPILQDFVELECDLVTRLFKPGNSDLSMIYHLGLILARPESLTKPLVDNEWLKKLKIEDLFADPDVEKLLSVIGTIRSIAARLTHDPDVREYFWGLLMNTLFLVGALEPDTTRYQRALLLGSVLCKRLSNWRNNAQPPAWPPAEWINATGSPYAP